MTWVQWRRLEGLILRRRAQRAGKWLRSMVGPTVLSPRQHARAMARGTCHWHRSVWTLVDPPVGTAAHWRRTLRGSE